jgi:GNAT superfamily N-acetyltransferase
MTFPHKDVQQLANIDYSSNLAIVGTVPGVSGEQVVAIAQYFLDPKTQAAEVAFLVQDEWQKKGMGTFLLSYITRIAKNKGVKRFYAKVLPANKAIARKGRGINEMFTVRRVVNNEGVERVFPLHSPNVVNIKSVRSGKIKRAKLYFLRKRTGKAVRLSQRHSSHTVSR